MNMVSNFPSRGTKRVMICEDEAIVALDLRMLVEDLGHTVIGPFATVAQSLKACADEHIDAAILDVQLRDGEIFPVAERLRSKGVTVIFHSGHAYEDELSKDYPTARFCPKPARVEHLVRHLKESLKNLAR
jgi:DNA-binding response OmpR family regulator